MVLALAARHPEITMDKEQMIAEAIYVEGLFNSGKIKVEECLEYRKVVDCKAVYRSLLYSRLFIRQAEGVFVGDDQKSQIIVPEVIVKAVLCCNLQKVSDLLVDASAESVVRCTLKVKILEYLAKLTEDGILCALAVDY